MHRTIPPDPSATREKRFLIAAILLLLLLTVLAGGAGAMIALTLYGSRPAASGYSDKPSASFNKFRLNDLTLAPLVARTAPAVANIAVLQPSPYAQNPLLRDPYFRDFFHLPEEVLAPRVSAGSGFVIDAARGLVITNRHVVQNAQAIEVTVGADQFEARLLGDSPENDIAVVQIAHRLPAQLELGRSEEVKVGDYVVAIGNPFQVGQTVTAGIVSALNKSTGRDASYVQTDAPINPGNSGGPLINMRGQVIGMNTAIIGPGRGNVGIGFAVPSDVVRRVAERIAKVRLPASQKRSGS